MIAGRRGGKGKKASVQVAYLAALCDWSDEIDFGIRGKVAYVAGTKTQANHAYSALAEIFRKVPLFRKLLKNDIAGSLELHNNIDIQIEAANWRTLRGGTLICGVMDEVSFFFSGDETKNEDDEILSALRYGTLTTKGPIICITSPHFKTGIVWNTYKDHYGSAGDADILVSHGATTDFNPTVDPVWIARMYKRDALKAASEIGGAFREDTGGFITLTDMMRHVPKKTTVRPPELGWDYVAFCDPSGGRSDAFTLAIAHREGTEDDGMIFLDRLDEFKAPFDPRIVCQTIAGTLRDYGLSEVIADNYGAELMSSMFSSYGVRLIPSPRSRTEIYLEALVLLNVGNLELLANDRMVQQFVSLQRRVSRGQGHEIIDHPPGGHEDLANAVAGALVSVASPPPRAPRPAIGR